MIDRRSFFWKILLPFLLTLTILFIIATPVLIAYITDIQNEKFLYQLEGIARTNDKESSMLLAQNKFHNLQAITTKLATEAQVRVTIIDTTGKVIAESSKDPSDLGSHKDRSEFIEALSKGFGKSIRYSWSLKEDMAYVAVPLLNGTVKLGVLRVSKPLSDNTRTIILIIGWTFLAWFLISSITVFTAMYVYKNLFHKLSVIKNNADRFAQGDFRTKQLSRDYTELVWVNTAINNMAQTLDKKIQEITKLLGQQDAILKSLAEGVIVVDINGKVIDIYKAAVEILGVDTTNAIGKNIHEVVRNKPLIRLVENTLTGMDLSKDEIILHTESGEKEFIASARVFTDKSGKLQGVVLVLNDITRLKHLEGIRRDFVSNVSHELRTPITSIKGSVETLLDGAIDNKQDAQKFVEIIFKQIERLSAIIEDLLLLSKIELGEEKGVVLLTLTNLCKSISEAINEATDKANLNGVQIKLECQEGLIAKINERLFEQAIFNLLDNAIKYSERGGIIQVTAKIINDEIEISVADNGIGIGKEHFPRLFERFYRVDKGRSRKEGGTGLGLAIVKHIITAHGGYVTVQSELGVGSTFTIHLPRE